MSKVTRIKGKGSPFTTYLARLNQIASCPACTHHHFIHDDSRKPHIRFHFQSTLLLRGCRNCEFEWFELPDDRQIDEVVFGTDGFPFERDGEVELD